MPKLLTKTTKRGVNRACSAAAAYSNVKENLLKSVDKVATLALSGRGLRWLRAPYFVGEYHTMSDPREDESMACLFARQDVKLNNIKFFRGTDYLISEERFTKELCASVKRQLAPAAIMSNHPPKCVKDSLDLRALVEQM